MNQANLVERPAWILPIIIFSQFAGTSLWFAGNAILNDLQHDWQLPGDTLGSITAAVQLGFIIGTLGFAFLSLPDRVSPRKLFLFCAMAGAVSNAAIVISQPSYALLLVLRFITGFCLAGLYPVGMKIAAGWYHEGLGKALGFLVGALVLGTAFPHLLNSLGGSWPWQTVMLAVSVLAICGGLTLFLWVPDGPFLSKGTPFDPKAIATIFSSPKFRASAFGYFGHMWELYAFWTYLPLLLTAHFTLQGIRLDQSFWAFLIIAAGSIGCAGGGLLTPKLGSARVATYQLGISGLCCLLSPLFFLAPTLAFLIFLLVWGITVAGDSPQFSTLNAQNAPKQLLGSALTIANSIGFAISIISIVLLGKLLKVIDPQYLFVVLLPGPLFGLYAMRTLLQNK